MTRKYDIVIFGATGYTGKVVVDEMIQTVRRLGRPNSLKWAIAGRSAGKLDEVLRDASYKHDEDFRSIPKILADVKNVPSLKLMASQCEIVLNCVGPYQIFGDQVIRACLAEGTHHLDVSGETIYLEKLQLLYHAEAEDKGCYILGSCGLSSIPTEIGVNFVEEKFNGEVNSIDVYADFQHGMPKFHIGSWHSLVYSLSRVKELKANRKELKMAKVSVPDFKVKTSLIHYNTFLPGWCFPFKSCDASVAIRSQNYFYENEKKRPAQVQVYMKSKSWKQSFKLAYMSIMIWLLATFRIGRMLLHQFPRVFAGGFLQNEKALSKVKNSKVRYVFVGEGWKEKRPECMRGTINSSGEKPNKRIIAHVEGEESVYSVTAICLIQAALTLHEELEKFPSRGGVYTPGVAFAKTSIINRLHSSGLKFHTVVEQTI